MARHEARLVASDVVYAPDLDTRYSSVQKKHDSRCETDALLL